MAPNRVTDAPLADTTAVILGPDRREERYSAHERLGLGPATPASLFGDIAKLAANALSVPYCAITTIDETRQTFVCSYGLPPDLEGSEIEYSLCRWPIESGQFLAISDTRANPLSAPTQAWEIGFRAYLAAPVCADDGVPIATLCVADDEPRTWTRRELSTLEGLARLLSRELENRALTQRLATKGAELEARQQRLAASQATFRQLVENSPFGIFVIDSEMRLALVGKGASDVFGGTAATLGQDFGEILYELWPSDFVKEVLERFRHTIATGESYRSSDTIRYDSHTETWSFDWQIERILLPDWKYGVVCHFYDLSEVRRHEQQIRNVMQEVIHRSKNTLTLVHAVARQTAAHSPKSFLKRFLQRIQALAKAQDLLLQEEWRSAQLEQLAREQLAHFQDLIESGRITFDGPRIDFEPAAVQAIGMAFHELATNAAKYGALSNMHGNIAISWWIEGSDLILDWRESGGPPVAKPKRCGVGTFMTRDVLRQSLQARVELNYAQDGLTWRLRCPVGKLTAEDSGEPARRQPLRIHPARYRRPEKAPLARALNL